MHPDAVKAFQTAQIDFAPDAQDMRHQEFEVRTQGQPKEKHIDAVYRIRDFRKEWILYHETLLSHDMLGNEFSDEDLKGVHAMPQFVKEFDPNTRQSRDKSFGSWKQTYELPFSPSNLKKLVESQPQDYQDRTQFYLHAGNARYGGFSFKEFFTESFEDLLVKATTGSYPAVRTPIVQTDHVAKKIKQKADIEKAEEEFSEIRELENRVIKDAASEGEESEEEEEEEEEEDESGEAQDEPAAVGDWQDEQKKTEPDHSQTDSKIARKPKAS